MGQNDSKSIGSMGKRGDFRYFTPMATRWMDNDVYQHINNVVYYSFIDTVANKYLIEQNALDIRNSAVVGLAVESGCQYRSPLNFPQQLDLGLRTGKVGRSSVRYEIGIFDCESDEAAAVGFFVHVYVDRSTNRPVDLPDAVRDAASAILVTV